MPSCREGVRDASEEAAKHDEGGDERGRGAEEGKVGSRGDEAWRPESGGSAGVPVVGGVIEDSAVT